MNKNNLTLKDTLQKFQNMWVAFDNKQNIIVSAKSYLKLHQLIPNDLKGKVEVTFINSSKAYLAP